MNIVIAPDSFKESLPASAVAAAILAGFATGFPAARCVCLPVADGGEGTVDAIVSATGGRVVAATVTGPLGQPVDAFFGLSGDGDTAIIEMAAASGLALVPPARRNPLLTGSHGTGELIIAALDAGARQLIIGIGGSATVDGGAGMLQALGAGLHDAQGSQIRAGGGALDQLARVDLGGLDARLADCTIAVACDVDNPLCGPQGAAAVFGPQKGATPAMVAALDANLAHYASVLARATGRHVAPIAGAGAAGGLGAALLAVLDARLRPGIDIVSEAIGLDAAIAAADLVVTGEGRLDGQTAHGKAPAGVAQRARAHGKPVIAIAGSLGDNAAMLHRHGIDAMFSVLPQPCTLEQALADAPANLQHTAHNVAALLRLGQCL
ncbi:Glycerate 3-kinase [Andreprevotia sp. IGB-42]|uniref:glycerate kinase n=1 Tax=Andreprevotia sp. IGB-42 TaxID=2497473 RepID=UPI00135CA9FD|nr:glycerate kinase [Andreprevotia sp. IGB-42]KAF0815373.1 Glycerate 3-kinase [Andreprevotia sp. IGB-42]